MDTKSLSRVEIKDADRGEVVAVFSTFDVCDHDGDVTVPGAFEDGAKTRISAYGHASHGDKLPVGKGFIRVAGNEAQLHGQFFMDTTHGRDTFLTVKAMSEDDLQEWSYGYDVLDYSHGEHKGKRVRFLKKLAVNEVSPVLLGAGIDTRTVAAKSRESMTFVGEAQAVLAAVTALADRAADVLAKRRERGKGLGTESGDLLVQVQEQCKRLASLLAEPPAESEAELEREYLRFVALAHDLAA